MLDYYFQSAEKKMQKKAFNPNYETKRGANGDIGGSDLNFFEDQEEELIDPRTITDLEKENIDLKE